jgi:hypothetical protein
MRGVGFAVGVAIAIAVSSSPAGAAEREHQLGGDVGGAMLLVADKVKTDFGAAVGAHYSYGLSDAFNLLVDGGWSLVAPGESATSASTPHTRPSSVSDVNAGVAYVFDVLQWVPWAGLLAGGYLLTGGTLSGAKFLPGAAVALGLDYRVSRSLSVGVSARQTFFTEASTYPSFTQGFVRVGYTWGW